MVVMIVLLLLLCYNMLMNLFEGNSSREKPAKPSTELDIIREQAAFLTEVATLIADLPEMKQPDREDHAFHFPVLPYSTPFDIPKSINLKPHEIDQIDIFLGDAHVPEHENDKPRQPYVTVDISAGDSVYKFSRSGKEEGPDLALTKLNTANYSQSELHTDFQNRFTDYGTVSNAELNSLLMSIAIPNEASDYNAYSNRELQSPSTFESLKELLKEKSYQTNSTYFFILKDGEAGLVFTKENSDTTSFTITYLDEKRKSPILVEYDVESDFSLRFFVLDGEQKQVILPTPQELRDITKLLQNEAIPYTAEQISEEAESQNETDPEKLLTSEPSRNELAGAVEEVLDELGLNPPNTST